MIKEKPEQNHLHGTATNESLKICIKTNNYSVILAFLAWDFDECKKVHGLLCEEIIDTKNA